MSKLTVQAMDSAAAMDEIVSKLGPDAVILSTTKSVSYTHLTLPTILLV